LFGWDFICSDVDVAAVAHARSTVERNSRSLAGHIRIVSVTTNSSLQKKVMGKHFGSVRYDEEEDDKCLSGDRPAVEGDGPVLKALRPLLLGHVGDCSSEEMLQAVMCNPPFYDLTEEVGTYSTSVCCTG
jgi:23S rRNA A1618 N6-methylase RlmF